MNNLGVYYQNIKNYDETKKYYLKAINLNNSHSMNNLGLYYKNIKKNNNLALKYFLLAIHYNFVQYKIDLSFAINVVLTPELIENIDENDKFPIYINSYIKLYKQYQTLLNEKIDVIELPFKYAPNESGFQEAKQDFIEKWNLKNNL